MNPKSLSAKKEKRETLLVECAIRPAYRAEHLKKLRTQRTGAFWIGVIQAAFFLLLVLLVDGMPTPYLGFIIFLIMSSAYQWETADRKIQLVRLIQHYQEEE
jgi:hypothetical protein